jgi:molecular chaperone Hsp33
MSEFEKKSLELLEEILGDEPIQFLETMPVSFTCTCSKERFGDAIVGLGADEIQDMIETDGQAEVHCHFCNEKFIFTKEELEQLKKDAKK